MGTMVGGPALLAIAAQIGLVEQAAVAVAAEAGGEGETSTPSYDDTFQLGQSSTPSSYDTSQLGQMGLATTALAIGNLAGSAVGGPLVDMLEKWNRVVAAAVLLNGLSIAAVPVVVPPRLLFFSFFFSENML
eukprot:SAG11_NODE_32_length_22830_cov_17.507941_4_plen_132_part_00